MLLALLCCALLLTFLFPAGDNPRVVRVGERKLERSERLAGAVIGAFRSRPCCKLKIVGRIFGICSPREHAPHTEAKKDSAENVSVVDARNTTARSGGVHPIDDWCSDDVFLADYALTYFGNNHTRFVILQSNLVSCS